MIKLDPKKRFDEIEKSIDWNVCRTPLAPISLQVIYQYGLMANKVDGFAAEAGVYTGYSLYTLAHVFDRQIYAFDSWNGIPKPTIKDGGYIEEGLFSADLDLVKKRLSFTDKVIYHKGFFVDTFPKVDQSVRFSYVFCDVDLYQSVVECFNFFYPKMNPGGILIFDDYFCKHTPGARIAIDEMIEKYKIKDTVYNVCGFVVFDIRETIND